MYGLGPLLLNLNHFCTLFDRRGFLIGLPQGGRAVPGNVNTPLVPISCLFLCNKSP